MKFEFEFWVNVPMLSSISVLYKFKTLFSSFNMVLTCGTLEKHS